MAIDTFIDKYKEDRVKNKIRNNDHALLSA